MLSEAEVETTTPATKIPSLFLIVILITLVLSIVSLYLAMEAFASQHEIHAGYFLMMGFVGLGVSLYMLLQVKARTLKIPLETEPMITTIRCRNCGFKNVREFQRGDFIFKELDETCPKCNVKMVIASIYREVKEKRQKPLPWL